MGSIPYTHRRDGGTYVLRKRISFRNRPSQHISYSLRTKEPGVARIRAAAACAALDRVVAVLNQCFSFNGGARPASELVELARRALDAQLGFALQDQLAGPDPDAEEAARVFGDFYALAARQPGGVAISDTERDRLIAEGRSDHHMRKLDLLVRHNVASQPLSDRHLELRLAGLGIRFLPTQADSDRRIVLTAMADAQHRAALFHTPSVQAHPNPIQHLINGDFDRTAKTPSAAPPASPARETGDNSTEHYAQTSAAPLLSTVIDRMIAAIVRAGKWKDGPGSTAEDARRLVRQFPWMVGDLPVDQYNQGHVESFEILMMEMPKSVRVQSVWHQDYTLAKRSFPELTDENKRNSRTLNKDLSYLATFAKRMEAVGLWKADAVRPLAVAHTVTAKQKARAKAPWTIGHVQQMFSCPIYTGNGGPKRRLKPGNFVYQDAAYWLLPLAAYTGGCQDELDGLLLDEIIIEGAAIPHIVIQENRLRTLKRDARERVVPIHPHLEKLGFLDFVAQLRRQGETELFSELWINAVKRGGDQYRTIVWDKLIVWLRAQGGQIPVGIGGKAADFQSLRSTVLSLLDRADINQNIVKDIAGHAREGVTACTYQDLVATGGLDEALRERLNVLERLPNFSAGVTPCTPKILPLNLRSR